MRIVRPCRERAAIAGGSQSIGRKLESFDSQLLRPADSPSVPSWISPGTQALCDILAIETTQTQVGLPDHLLLGVEMPSLDALGESPS